MSERKNPGGVGAPRGADGDTVCKPVLSTKTHRRQEVLRVRTEPDGALVTVRGREAQTLRLLIDRGAAGFTSGEAAPLGWARPDKRLYPATAAAGLPN